MYIFRCARHTCCSLYILALHITYILALHILPRLIHSHILYMHALHIFSSHFIHSYIPYTRTFQTSAHFVRYVAVCCSVLQCVAVCCSVSHTVCSHIRCAASRSSQQVCKSVFDACIHGRKPLSKTTVLLLKLQC